MQVKSFRSVRLTQIAQEPCSPFVHRLPWTNRMGNCSVSKEKTSSKLEKFGVFPPLFFFKPLSEKSAHACC